MPKKVMINGQVVKLHSERETRANVLSIARELNCEQDVLQIFAKYDTKLKRCTNEQERMAISIEANEVLHFFMSSRPGYLLIVGANKVIGRE